MKMCFLKKIIECGKYTAVKAVKSMVFLSAKWQTLYYIIN